MMINPVCIAFVRDNHCVLMHWADTKDGLTVFTVAYMLFPVKSRNP